MRLFFAIVGALVLFPATLWAYGEGGDIPYTSRAIHLMTNEARLDSAYALRDCGANCSEGVSCYQKTVDPLYWNDELFRAAQFHANMLSTLDNCMQHASPCELVSTAAQDFPDTCDGNPSCACQTGKAVCKGPGTPTFERIRAFCKDASAENLVSTWRRPVDAFHLWLFEKGEGSGCAEAKGIGHRYAILADKHKSQGIGVKAHIVQDFARTVKEVHAIAAAGHYWDKENALQFKAVYKDASGADDGSINIGGECHDIKLSRGSSKHGLWSMSLANVPAKCTPYVFEISNEDGKVVRYPSTGSLLYGEHEGEVCAKSWQSSALESCFEDEAEKPADSVKPPAPSKPIAPTKPADSVKPPAPTKPIAPSKPANSVKPVAPSKPAAPIQQDEATESDDDADADVETESDDDADADDETESDDDADVDEETRRGHWKRPGHSTRPGHWKRPGHSTRPGYATDSDDDDDDEVYEDNEGDDDEVYEDDYADDDDDDDEHVRKCRRGRCRRR